MSRGYSGLSSALSPICDANACFSSCRKAVAAVLISSLLPKIFYCPAWLCGWAIGLTVMGPMEIKALGNMPLQIAAAMFAGVWYVGVLVEWIHQKMCKTK